MFTSAVCLHFCLFQQNPSTEGSLKPVMVWFHGGGFVGGSGSSEVYGPDYLVAEDVVVVTLNYRLGPFGNYVRFVVSCHFNLSPSENGDMYCHHFCLSKCTSAAMTIEPVGWCLKDPVVLN
jgi:hypothetical protein